MTLTELTGVIPMIHQRLRHDHSEACTTVIADLIRHLLREEEIAEFQEQCYAAIMAMWEHYDTALQREKHRLRPID
jgi:hypothetical protein